MALSKEAGSCISMPEANMASFLLGVRRYAPLYLLKSEPLGSTNTFLLWALPLFIIAWIRVGVSTPLS